MTLARIDTQEGLLDVERARAYLDKSRSRDEVKKVRDQAQAIKMYLRSQKAGIESQNAAAEVVIRAERRLGELAKDLPRAPPDKRGQGRRNGKSGPAMGLDSKAEALAAEGVTKQAAHRWEKLADIAPDKFEAAIAEAREQGKPLTKSELLKKEKQDTKRAQKVAEAKSAPEVARIRRCDAVKLLDSLGPNSVDLLLTDPPYMTDVDEPIRDFAARWLMSAVNAVKPTGRAYICIGAYPEELHAYLGILLQQKKLQLANVLVWTYRNTLGPQPSHAYKQNWQAILYLHGEKAARLDCPVMVEQFAVQDINAPDGRLGDRYHAWQKPDELAERFVRHSSKPGDLVVDPFACTGTFLLAAAKRGRRAIGSDISVDNLKIAAERGCVVEP